MLKSKFLSDVLSVITGTVIVQLIPILASLVIARLYLPTEFGGFSAWLSIVYILATVFTCRYETALALVDDGKERDFALLAIFIVVFMWLGIVFSGVLLVGGAVAKYNLPMLILVAPTAALFALNVSWQERIAADGDYKKLIKIRGVQFFFGSFFQIFIGFFYPNAESLCWAFLVGELLLFCLTWLVFLFRQENFMKVDCLMELRRFLTRYKKFAIVGLPAATINTIAIQLPVIILLTRFGSDFAGAFALTMRVLGAPIGLVGKSVLDVFKRTAAQAYKKRGECRDEYVKTFRILMLGALVLLIGTLALAEDIFDFLYGDNWRESGKIAIFLLPLFCMRFMASPLSYMVFIAEKQDIDLVWQIMLLGVTLFTLFAFSSFYTTIISYAIGYAILYVVYLLLSYSYSKGRF